MGVYSHVVRVRLDDEAPVVAFVLDTEARTKSVCWRAFALEQRLPKQVKEAFISNVLPALPVEV